MIKERAREQYYKALEEAINEVAQSFTGVRKDVARRLVLGATTRGNTTEIAQEAGTHYETVLKGLDS
ncbi:hypothetical protein KN1_29470 [Stygiolobus caldivivus]|uniref:Uncharacterized protein n=1 Tax=Stygiolobus caldivivus TaxID=2824673 RepID=A0A8D5U8B8_9CREN|nr:hypothetical protein KN1_29470 [Stygiolobus caldivivus]